MDVVVSPVPARPEVFSYLHHAFACEVLRGHPGFADWLAGTFLRVYAHRRFDGCSVPANFDVGDRLMVDAVTGRITTAVVPYYERIPILRTARAERPEPDPQRWAALIGELTGDGHALLVYADKRYVPGSAEYGERSGTHQVMYRRSAEGLTVHCLGARGGYARSATSER
ncbi:MAG TPA: hypothetical protein VN408_40750, partial [Actinoplanes sp.]|nr:hypothetical protein [Actinoplanes sp.]